MLHSAQWKAYMLTFHLNIYTSLSLDEDYSYVQVKAKHIEQWHITTT